MRQGAATGYTQASLLAYRSFSGKVLVKVRSAAAMMHLKRRWARLLSKASAPLGLSALGQEIAHLRQKVDAISSIAKENQILLMLAYQKRKADGEPLLPLHAVEFRSYSQNGEDGILCYIFSLLGTTSRRSVEICVGDGTQCNTANLILNHGWEGLLVDGNELNVLKGKAFYEGHPNTVSYPPRFVHIWVTRENVNELVQSSGFEGEIDLLSLDIDGVDYWIWDAISVIRPRVVVLEAQVIWGADRSVTVPYRSDFRAEYVNGYGVYSGASLPAFVKLARAKGYRLIGAQLYGYNAFFIRDDVGVGLFPEVSAAECLTHPFVRWAQETLLPLVKDKEWVEV